MDFRTHVAEDIFFKMINEARVPVYFQQRLVGVRKKGTRILELEMGTGKMFRSQMFINASYEGDLMAKAGVRYAVGREANAQYGETLDGVRGDTPKHQFEVAVDPYVTPGDPSSGLLPFVQAEPRGRPGDGDRSVQAYNFRLCYTQNASNRLPLTPPQRYDPARYELLARYLEALVATGHAPRLSQFWNPILLPNAKTDINNNGGFSTDFIGANYDYPDGDAQTRKRIWSEHADYIRGFVFSWPPARAFPWACARRCNPGGLPETNSWTRGLAPPTLRARGSPYGVGLCHDRA